MSNVDEGEKDELFDEAIRIVLQTKRCSVSLLQRRLTIGYGRASRLIEQMAASGIDALHVILRKDQAMKPTDIVKAALVGAGVLKTDSGTKSAGYGINDPGAARLAAAIDAAPARPARKPRKGKR